MKKRGSTTFGEVKSSGVIKHISKNTHKYNRSLSSFTSNCRKQQMTRTQMSAHAVPQSTIVIKVIRLSRFSGNIFWQQNRHSTSVLAYHLFHAKPLKTVRCCYYLAFSVGSCVIWNHFSCIGYFLVISLPLLYFPFSV